MNIDTVIAQLKTAPFFGGRVAGAAEYSADQVWMDRPAAYVIPLEDEADPNSKMTGLAQLIHEKIGIVVDLDNSADRRGQAAAQQAVAEARSAVFGAILNWREMPSRQSRGFSYAGGGLHPGMNREFLRWQFDFTIETQITDHDGWQNPSEDLVCLEIHTRHSKPSGDEPPLFTIPLRNPPNPGDDSCS